MKSSSLSALCITLTHSEGVSAREGGERGERERERDGREESKRERRRKRVSLAERGDTGEESAPRTQRHGQDFESMFVIE